MFLMFRMFLLGSECLNVTQKIKIKIGDWGGGGGGSTILASSKPKK